MSPEPLLMLDRTIPYRPRIKSAVLPSPTDSSKATTIGKTCSSVKIVSQGFRLEGRRGVCLIVSEDYCGDGNVKPARGDGSPLWPHKCVEFRECLEVHKI